MALLQVEDVSVSFGGVKALDSVSLDADPGYITGLIGPNGAGKTTLFNVICGLQQTDDGRVIFDDRDVGDLKPFERARLGLGRTFQKLEVFDSLSVFDNVLVAAEIRKGRSRGGTSPKEDATRIIERMGISSVVEARVDSLPTGTARLVELARALAAQPRLILLDEPSSGLSEQESDDLASLLVALAEEGVAILLVEHAMELVMGVSRRIYVLDFGKVLSVGSPKEVQKDAAVQEAYLGAPSKD
ncbi:MAG: ABC transporter ATP-binding protein [Acidimicrobiia bacterium]